MTNVKAQMTKFLRKRPVILDGAIGTELQKKGMPQGACPEKWCIENPDILASIQSEYLRAGSDIIYTSTFGANKLKLKHFGIKDVTLTNKKLALIAKKEAKGKAFVAGDMGPLGAFIEPFGGLKFEEAVDIFKEQAKGLLLGGVDLFIIETMMDAQEARAALLAVKEISDKFAMVTMTFEKSGYTLAGNSPISSLITLQSLGAGAFGCNCSTGPEDMAKFIALMKPYAAIPLIAKPNAGMPKFIDNKTVFEMNAKRFASYAPKLIKAGADIIGGCCGTTPEHIRGLKSKVKSQKSKLQVKSQKYQSAVSSARGYWVFDKRKFTVIGEKINPTGKPALQKELRKYNMELLRKFAEEQKANGANLLDINVGCAGIDEKKAMEKAIAALAVATTLPLVIDSSNPEIIERALRLYPGRAVINSISHDKLKMKKLFSLAKKYGAMFILLPLMGKKIPESFSERKKAIKSMLIEAKREGFSKGDILIDALVMAISTNEKAAIETLKTIEWVSKEINMRTLAGLSNISFGMPKRNVINAAFLSLARKKGLNAAIIDPADAKHGTNRTAENLLLGKDKGGAEFIKHFTKTKAFREKKHEKKLSIKATISNAIINGSENEIIPLLKKAVNNHAPFNLIKNVMIPAIVKVGKLFDKKDYFLPQLVRSAETMKKGMSYLEPFLKKGERNKNKKPTIIIATVKGDIHDIGKNIVALMLKNHGFNVIDLGKDVPVSKIIRHIKRKRPVILGLSALMTTTMVNMKEVIKKVKQERLKCKFIAGGAAVTSGYAESIGAEYAKDSVKATALAKKLIK